MISCDPQARASSDSLISITSTNSLPYTILFILEDYFILPCSFQDAVLIRGQATLIVSYYFFLSLRDFSCGVGVCHSFWMLIFKISVSTLKHTDYMRILFVILMHSGQACFMWFWNFPFVPHVEVCLGDAAADSVDLFAGLISPTSAEGGDLIWSLSDYRCRSPPRGNGGRWKHSLSAASLHQDFCLVYR